MLYFDTQVILDIEPDSTDKVFARGQVEAGFFKMTGKLNSPLARSFLKSLLYSVWLPVSILVLSLIRFGIEGWSSFDDLQSGLATIGWLFLLTWPCGLPLTIALRKLYRRSRAIAYLTAVVLIPLSAVAAITGGLLGPIGILGYTAVFSLPAWLILCISHLRQQWRQRNQANSSR